VRVAVWPEEKLEKTVLLGPKLEPSETGAVNVVVMTVVEGPVSKNSITLMLRSTSGELDM
jgi:hypothetical protein